MPNSPATPSEHPYSSLTPDRVLDAIESQGYLCDGRILALNSYENRVYQVGIEDSLPVIAKFYRPARWSQTQILEEHQFCHELQEAEWPVVAPMTNAEGESLFSDGEFSFALFERKGGYAPELDNLDNLETLGRELGRLHALGATKPFESRPAIDLQCYGIDSREFLLQHDFLPMSLASAYDSITADLLKTLEKVFKQHRYQSIRLHADCHPGNILWRDDAPLFVDFDDCRMGPAIQDLWMLFNGSRDHRQAQLEVLVDAYNEFGEFQPSQLGLIEALRTLRLMHYAAWLARRWQDPAFPQAFPWFNTERYWGEHILSLREQQSALQEPPLQLLPGNW